MLIDLILGKVGGHFKKFRAPVVVKMSKEQISVPACGVGLKILPRLKNRLTGLHIDSQHVVFLLLVEARDHAFRGLATLQSKQQEAGCDLVRELTRRHFTAE